MRRVIRTDGSNPWANHTIVKRLPAILDQVITENQLTRRAVQGLTRLKGDLQEDQPIEMFESDASDRNNWADYWAAHNRRVRGTATWQNAEWFFAEHFFYRTILEIVGYAHSASDPYAAVKKRELHSPELGNRVASVMLNLDLPERLAFSLWGNQMDQSHRGARSHAGTGSRTHIIADQSAEAIRRLEATEGPVHFVNDNAGTELVADLILADWLLQRGVNVVFHLKAQPTFVSDATVQDCQHAIQWLGETSPGTPAPTPVDRDQPITRRRMEIAERLSAAIRSARLCLEADFYWNSPLFIDDLPARLVTSLGEANLVIVKGDMNYRRHLHDTVVPATEPLSQHASPLPAPMLFLRTMKGDPIAGLDADTLATLDRDWPDWRTAGRHAVVQLVV